MLQNIKKRLLFFFNAQCETNYVLGFLQHTTGRDFCDRYTVRQTVKYVFNDKYIIRLYWTIFFFTGHSSRKVIL